MFSSNKSDSGKKLIISNHSPVSALAAAVAMAVVMASSLMVAVPMHLAGLWLIWPFTIGAIAVFTVALVCTARPWQQVVSVTERAVTVFDAGRNYCIERWHSVPYWTKVVFRHKSHPWYNDSLFLRSRGRQIEIGYGLKDGKRIEVAQILAEDILHSAQYGLKRRSPD